MATATTTMAMVAVVSMVTRRPVMTVVTSPSSVQVRLDVR